MCYPKRWAALKTAYKSDHGNGCVLIIGGNFICSEERRKLKRRLLRLR